MSFCRTCLADSADKDITGMEEDGRSNSFKDVFLFCLDIEVNEELAKYTKVCFKCYKKILSFYEFKSLAQKNDVYLRTLETNYKESLDTFYILDVKNEEPEDNNYSENNNDHDVGFADEMTIKEEAGDYDESDNEDNEDNELLSVIKLIKYENNLEDSKERKRGRRKKCEKIDKSEKTEKKIAQVCEECGKSVYNLKLHMIQHQPKSDRKKLKCRMCEKTFLTSSARCKHYSVKHLGIKQRCKICGKEVVNMWSHNLTMHSESRRVHQCPGCPRRFASPALLASHARVHSNGRPFQCDQCDKSFGSKVVLVQHRRQVHDKEKTHLCQFCSKSFFKKYHLQVHIRTHSKEKPYECTMCGKFFSSCTTLKNHKLLHSGTKLYECPQCAMTFSTSAYLRTHMVIHSKVKKHPCKYCGVKFLRSDHKKRHEKTAHEKHILGTAITFES